MYDADSFYTLTGSARVGLVVVSATIAVGMAWLVRRMSRERRMFTRCVTWAVLFYLFIWLSPQGYYAYYRLVFDGLPQQWIVGTPTSLVDALRILTFTGPPTLSAHSLGILGWALLILALWPQRSNCRDAAN